MLVALANRRTGSKAWLGLWSGRPVFYIEVGPVTSGAVEDGEGAARLHGQVRFPPTSWRN
jgi:hypothetical protein